MHICNFLKFSLSLYIYMHVYIHTHTLSYIYFYIVVFILISYIGGQEELLCSHEALHLALLNPTVYTEITGNTCKYIMYI